MKILILGAGAVGSLLGALLQEGGNSVLLVGREDHVAAVRAQGLRVSGPRPRVVPLEAAAQIPSNAEADVVIVTTKTFDLATAMTALARSLTARPTLLLQNGLGVLPLARNALATGGWSDPVTYLVRGVNSIPATWVGPGEVREPVSGRSCSRFRARRARPREPPGSSACFSRVPGCRSKRPPSSSGRSGARRS